MNGKVICSKVKKHIREALRSVHSTNLLQTAKEALSLDTIDISNDRLASLHPSNWTVPNPENSNYKTL
jgi:hypothetical protein